MRKAARPTTKADESPEFVAFWDDVWKPPVRHKNDGRGAARDEFVRHVELYGVDPQDIVDGARHYVANGGNGEFKLHAQTWLNRRQYEDGCIAWRQRRIEQSPANIVRIEPRGQTAFLRQFNKREA